MSATMAEVSEIRKEEESIYLPPGFRFHPTDEEIITSYLTEKIVVPGFTSRVMGEVDLNKCEPWDLPSKAKMGEKEWYFFCQKDRKYPTGMRTNRATEAGYWKATGKDKEIYRGKDILVGMKKTLVFYKGRAPKGEKTNWVMHEFRLEAIHGSYNRSTDAKDEWVVCKVFHKGTGIKRTTLVGFASTSSNSAISADSIMDHRPMFRNDNEVSCGNNFRSATILTEPSSSWVNRGITHQNQSSLLSNYYTNTCNQANSSMSSHPYNFIPPGLTNMEHLHQEQEMAKALAGTFDASDYQGVEGNEGKVLEQPNSNISMFCHSKVLNDHEGLKSSFSKRGHSDYELDGISSAGPFSGFDSLWKH